MKPDESVYVFVNRPEDGQPTLGVVFHVVREREIRELTGYEPIGYIVEPMRLWKSSGWKDREEE